MTEEDIRSIESALSVSLPQAYRAAVCPFPVRAFIGNTDTELWDDAEGLIDLNRRLHQKEKWPANLFAVGAQDDGTKMAMDLNSPDNTMWWVDRAIDAPGTSAERDGFAAWSAELLRQMRSGEYMDGFDPENDPPGTRERLGPQSLGSVVGCAAAIVGVAVVGALVIFGVKVLQGWP